ncbi:PepSY-associated TM helix domain-containing protein [Porphyromonas sp.]|uniref:PepSY-associated TM helix domain-containing protein n=1 Tax=Porphyromonas sp. TaxID=1924944 RepID=UPI0026DB598E|nr:PepSY-associated TM helix domain-containing protein [Porphyromonas sp.]MDO4771784.1 PepSY-associated TM helix domain-containing protein [Porphyromonas sp.]
MRKFLLKTHKWVSIILLFFILMFAVSGIILNHRGAVSGIDLSRTLLPKGYEYKNWNNGSVSGSLTLRDSSVWIYGGSGVRQTDRDGSRFVDRNTGLPPGADHRSMRSLVETASGELLALSAFSLYKYDVEGEKWAPVEGLPHSEKSYTDLIALGDSVLLLSRSHLYLRDARNTDFVEIQLQAPDGYSPKVSLFRTLWLLHSGELFGLAGQIVVDIVGLILIILCVTGLIITIKIMITKQRKKKGLKTDNKLTRFSLKWHNKLGSLFLVLLLLVTFTGMFLRPPLLIAIIRSKVSPIPGTELHSDNPWHDKLRRIRHDKSANDWLLSTSEGFFTLSDLTSRPAPLKKTPPVSVMGITAWQQQADGKWVVGSFSGLFEWDRETGDTFDLIKGEPYAGRKGGMPTFDNAISGYSDDFRHGALLFDYSKGARFVQDRADFVEMPDEMCPGRISLWHTALELHVGRLYDGFMDPVAPMFVFLAGFFLLSVIITGYIIYHKWHKRHKKKKA